MSEQPIADLSVRLAWADDADAIGRLQVAAWQEAYAGIVPADVLAQLPSDEFASKWRRSISRPREARERVLVALERVTVRGFVATAPSTDADADPGADGEVAELIVDPDHRAEGHGSRLVHAAIDTLRADRFSRATVWVNAAGDRVHAFFVGQGWSPDGARRELDLYGDREVVVTQVRLHTAL